VAIGRRKEQSGNAYGASFLELFFDLVFVFAVTQISHLLLEDLSWIGAGKSAIMLLAVWWAWSYTTWVTNELDVDAVQVRLLMFGLMLAGLLMAIAIPQAFAERALLFALAYVAIQVGRTAFLAFAASDRGTEARDRSVNILIWFCGSAVFWIAGALTDDGLRSGLWVIALLIDYAAPLFVFRVPGRPGLSISSWDLGTDHFAERFGLFVIIALGESVILTGATAADLDLDGPVLVSLTFAFVGTAALWWLYFSEIAGRVSRGLAESENSTLIGRDVFTYGHALIVAGIILFAVGDEIVIAHPTEALTGAELLTVIVGPMFYLTAQSVLSWRMTGRLSSRRATAVVACGAVGLAGLAGASALAVSGLLAAVLVILVIADNRAFSDTAPAGAGSA
jgi:low temperature requirement protein LtrA